MSAGKETQNLALEMKLNIVGRGLPTSFLLHPNSHCSFLVYSRKLWMNHLLVIYLPVPTIVFTCSCLQARTSSFMPLCLPHSAINTLVPTCPSSHSPDSPAVGPGGHVTEPLRPSTSQPVKLGKLRVYITQRLVVKIKLDNAISAVTST